MNSFPNIAMVAAAHPDDAEFGCGGTIYKWIQQGTKVFYLIGTNGDKGDDGASRSPEELAELRAHEQQQAAGILGIQEVVILPRPDGLLTYSAELRGELVHYIRKWKPDVLLTHDPTVFIQPWGGINHSDHRTIGAIALDAAYPYARGRLNYPDQIAQGLEPHKVSKCFVWGSDHPNHVEDVSEQVEKKLEALFAHKSQFPDADGMRTYCLEYMEREGRERGFKYGEAFRVIDLF